VTHKVIAVVVDPTVVEPHQVFEFEANQWYEALDLLCTLWLSRFPARRPKGVDHLEIRAMSMIKIED
jgi:hypothetical protein